MHIETCYGLVLFYILNYSFKKNKLMKFAKLFDLENDEQVLVVKDYDNDREKDIVTVSTDFEAARAAATYSFKDEETQLKMFDSFDIESAKRFRTAMEADFS